MGRNQRFFHGILSTNDQQRKGDVVDSNHKLEVWELYMLMGQQLWDVFFLRETKSDVVMALG
jgi:hypothetical protein